jgi:short-subunit dehydrogenase
MNPTVLITGASQGIGRETARLFARNGYNVVLAARQSDRLEALAQELRTFGHSAIAIPTDVKDPTQVNTLVQKALDHYRSIDVLINNAGIYISGPVDKFTLEDWHQAIDTNLWGYIHTIQALLPHFLAQRSGTIVNLGSIGGMTPIPYLVPYTTSKFAITGLTRALHSELAPKGIHVCGIYPNLIKTDFLERAIFQGNDAQDIQARRQQVEQVLDTPIIEKPEDVAQAVWDAVKQKRTEVVVGSANLSAGINRLFPSLMQWLLRQTFKNKD